MKSSFFFYKELTPAEVGKTGTHEIYIRLPNNFDYESFFYGAAEQNGPVVEYNFDAIDNTDGGNDLVRLRFVYFIKSNKEKRIPSLSSLFEKHKVQESDIVCIESRLNGQTPSFFIHFYKRGEIQINPTAIFFSVSDSVKEKEKAVGSKDVKVSFQQIFYGAPGTGKSNSIKRIVDDQGKTCFRTTFHPDSDYSTFVGCYKPTMKRSTITKDGITSMEEKIVYRFEPQAFTNAYVQAWMSKEEVYLIIEEINRGNCAQIFGDLFQLLDRKNGESEYPIDADSALADHLHLALAKSERDDIPEKVKSGEKLKLPSNLYIWATMNTSDQSLFPIDSAFKRRWDWVYIPIKPHNEGYMIKIGDTIYDWWVFLEKINQVIGDTTSSEDKKLGYFFVKTENKEISADKFVSKVLFYLWNDVFKNYGFEHPVFSRGDNKKFTFSDFFMKDGSPDKNMVNQFLKRLDEIIDKEKSFVKILDADDVSSSFIVKYKGEYIEGGSALERYVEVVRRAVAEKGGEMVSNCIGAGLTQTPIDESTRKYIPIADTGWFLATNVGIEVIKKNILKIKDGLNIDIDAK